MSFTHAGRTIGKVAVIGSGQIGPDIALYFTKVLSPFKVPIVVVDVAPEALERGEKKLTRKVAKGVETGAFTPEQQQAMLDHVSFTTDYDAIRGAFREIKTRYAGKRIGYPRIGAGLAGGDWDTIATIIDEELGGEDHTLVEFVG